MGCGAETDAANGLCPKCWTETEFIYDLACSACGTPLIGEGAGLCEECFSDPPPWDDGVAVAVYGSVSARITQSLKHGDRLELVPKLGDWMASTTRSLASPNALVIPIPLHWRRLISRRYNQSALLAEHIAKRLDLEYRPNALGRATPVVQQKTMTRPDRMANQANSFFVKQPEGLKDRHVILVDDVMTSGATLKAACTALNSAKVKAISISVFARVAPNL